MKNQPIQSFYTFFKLLFLIFLALATFGAMVWVNSLYAREHMGEKEFFVPWLAAQTFLRYGDSSDPEAITPYSLPAAQRAQIIYYGRLAEEGEDPLDLWLAFPAELFYFLFALISKYEVARGLFVTLCQVALVGAAILAIRLSGWKARQRLWMVLLLIPVLSFAGVVSMVSASNVAVVVLASIGALLAVREEQDEIGGLLLTLPFLKLGIFSIFVLFVLWWALAHRRWRILAGLGMGLGVLFLLATILLPGWLMPSLRGWISHQAYSNGFSTYRLLGNLFPVAGPRMAGIASALLLVMVFVAWRDVRRKDFLHVLWTACQALLIAPLVGIPVAGTDQVVFFLPVFFIGSIVARRWPGKRSEGVALIVMEVYLLASWLAGFFPWAVLLVPVLSLAGLYWMQWWIKSALHPVLVQGNEEV